MVDEIKTENAAAPEPEKKNSTVYVIVAAIIAIGLVFLIYLLFSPNDYETTITTTVTRIEPLWLSDTEIRYIETTEVKESLPQEAASDPDAIKEFGGSMNRYNVTKEEKTKVVTDLLEGYVVEGAPPVGNPAKPYVAISLTEGDVTKLLIAQPIREDNLKNLTVVKTLPLNFESRAGFDISPDGKKVLIISEHLNTIQAIFIDKSDGPKIVVYQESRSAKGMFSN